MTAVNKSSDGTPTRRGYYWVKLRGFADEWQIARLSVYPTFASYAERAIGVPLVWFRVGNEWPLTMDSLLDWRGPIKQPRPRMAK